MSSRIPLIITDHTCDTCILQNSCKRESAPNRFFYDFLYNNEALERVKKDKLMITIQCRDYINKNK